MRIETGPRFGAMKGRDLVSIGDAARVVGCSRDAIDKGMRDGRLRFSKIDGRRMADLSDVLMFKRSLWSIK
jgi:hypothetical protein